jgi:hypothetical protein
VGFPLVDKEDDAWITDVSLEYRLPQRLGVITVGARNVFDDSIDLFEVDPFNPIVATQQFVYGSVRFVF